MDMTRFFKDLMAAPDRGKSFYQANRDHQHLASLVEAGRHAGRSRVHYAGRNIQYHLFTKGGCSWVPAGGGQWRLAAAWLAGRRRWLCVLGLFVWFGDSLISACRSIAWCARRRSCHARCC